MDETPLSDQQIDWLLQWDEALAKGANAPQDSASQSPTDSGLANHVRCMKLLRMKQAILHSPSQHLQKSQTDGENTTVGLQSQENIRAIQVVQANFSGQLSDTLQVESNLQLTHPSVQSVPIHFGKFELIEEIGQGGYGIVFLARDRVLGRDVALKMPHANVMLKDDLLTRFRLEARAAGALDHPNIVQVFDAGSIGPVGYIASAYCPGTSLHEWIQKRTKVIALNDAARLILCLARAIQHANERGVFHRDLKPANILLQPSESYLQATGNIHTDQREQLVALAQAASLADLVPRITDFGLAKLTGQSLATLSGSVLGTPAYMAPEQASGQRQSSDSRVDVYSLGAILYQLLTGCLPFDGQTPWETLNRVIHEPVVPIRSRRHDIHRDLETICLKCLEKEPQQRYASAGLLADDLQRFIQNRPISARPATTRELLMRLFRRQPVASSLVLGTVLAMTLGLIIVIRLYRQSEDQRNRITTALNAAAQANEQATQQRQASERLTYLNSIAVADRESALDLSHARQKLVRCDPQLRDWEWDYLWKKCHPELLELTGHSQPTGVCCFSPDGSLLASGSGMWGRTTDGEVIVRETRTGEVLLQIDDIAGQVTGLDFHPTKNWLVVSEHTWRNDRSGVTKVWDLDSRQVVASLRLSRNTYSVCFDPAGDFVVTGGADGRIRFFRTANWRLARTINHHRQSVLAVTFDSTGQWLASAGRDGQLCVFDAQSREIVYQQDDLNDVRCVAFSPDSKYLACSTFDGQVFVWQTRDWELVARYAAPSKRVGSLEFCPDGDSILLSMISGPTQIWDVRTGQVRRSIPAHYPSTLYASCNVQGDLIATTGSDAKVRLWSVASQTEPLRYRVQSNFISDIVMIPNTNLVATGSTRNIASSGMGDKQYFVHLFDHTNGKTSRILKGHEDWISKLSITPDGQVLASTSHDGKVKLWSVAKGDCLHTLSGHSAPLIGAVFLDRQTLVSACQLGQLKFWDVSTGTNTRQRDTQLMGASSIVASSQTGWLALGNANGEIRIWNVDSPEHCIELQGHTGLINCMDFSDDGTQLAAGGISHQITFWDLPDKQECVDSGVNQLLAKLVCKLPGREVQDLQFLPQGQRLAYASTNFSGSASVRMLDTVTGEEALHLIERDEIASSLAFNPQRNELVLSVNSHLWLHNNKLSTIQEKWQRHSDDVLVWHEQQADWAEKQHRYFKLAYHLNSLINQDSPSGLYLRRANAFAGLEQWELAKKDLSRYQELTPGSADSRFYLALLCLAYGDLTAFHSECEAMISQYASSETPDHANALAWLLALTPERPNDLQLMIDRIEFACDRAKESSDKSLALNTLGLTYYRNQRYQEALRAIQESIRLQDGMGSEPDWIVLSMIYSKLGNKKEAKNWYAQAYQSLNSAVGLGNPVSKKHSRNWISRFQLVLLLTEAQQLIKPEDS